MLVFNNFNEEEKKSDRILIRCRPSTKRKFRKVVVDMNAKSYEEALLKLISLYYNKKEEEEITLY